MTEICYIMREYMHHIEVRNTWIMYFNLMVTGVMRRIVVTLSRKADTMAVKKQSPVISGQTCPFAICVMWDIKDLN